jgi:hypothetical protein
MQLHRTDSQTPIFLDISITSVGDFLLFQHQAVYLTEIQHAHPVHPVTALQTEYTLWKHIRLV